jgi:nitrite reductase/ring-hydroxylating ferredoxin subunit
MTSSARHLLCHQSDVADPGVRAFELQLDNVLLEGILIHWHGGWYAFRNACPHTGVNLNWSPGQFFDLQQRYLQCSLHGALFEPDNGVCVFGPCQGEVLTPLQVSLDSDEVYLTTTSISLQ